jgi:hypothetical protein
MKKEDSESINLPSIKASEEVLKISDEIITTENKEVAIDPLNLMKKEVPIIKPTAIEERKTLITSDPLMKEEVPIIKPAAIEETKTLITSDPLMKEEVSITKSPTIEETKTLIDPPTKKKVSIKKHTTVEETKALIDPPIKKKVSIKKPVNQQKPRIYTRSQSSNSNEVIRIQIPSQPASLNEKKSEPKINETNSGSSKKRLIFIFIYIKKFLENLEVDHKKKILMNKRKLNH